MSDKVPHGKEPASVLKRVIVTGLKIAFAAGLIIWMIKIGALNFDAFARLSSPLLIAFCILSGFAQIFFNNYRWLLLLRGRSFPTSVGRTLPLSLIGMFFNFIFPGGVGGDVVKGYYVLQEHPEKKLAAAVSIFMDRLTGFFVMITMAFFALGLNLPIVLASPNLTSVAIAVSALFAGFCLFYALSLTRVLQAHWARQMFAAIPGGKHLRSIYEAVHAYRHSLSHLGRAMLVSVVSQCFVILFIYAIGQALGETSIPISVYIFLVPIGLVVQALPLSPAGIGVGQAAFYFLFNSYLGRESQLGPTAMTVLQLVSFLWGLVGAYFYLTRRKPVALAEA